MFWKIETLGVTSEDFMRAREDTNRGAFHGQLWRFANEATPAKEPKVVSQPNPKMIQQPLQNHLIDQAAKLGFPTQRMDTATPEEVARLQEEIEANMKNLAPAATSTETSGQNPDLNQQNQDDGIEFSESQLKRMNKDQLQEIAANVGVANLEQTKEKLVEAILSVK